MKQAGRYLATPLDGFFADTRFLILDRDQKYSKPFRRLLENSGIEISRLPRRSPNLKAYTERFVRFVKEEGQSRMAFFGDQSLRKATRESAAHDHEEQNHWGVGNRSITPKDPVERSTGRFDNPSASARCAVSIIGLWRSPDLPADHAPRGDRSSAGSVRVRSRLGAVTPSRPRPTAR